MSPDAEKMSLDAEKMSLDAEKMSLDAENFETSESFKESVYEQINEGVPSLMMDLKLEIFWRLKNDKKLDDYMEEMLK